MSAPPCRCVCVSRGDAVGCRASSSICHLIGAPALGGWGSCPGGRGCRCCLAAGHSMICSSFALPVGGVASSCPQSQVTRSHGWACKPHLRSSARCCVIGGPGLGRGYSARKQYQCWSLMSGRGLSSESLRLRREGMPPRHRPGRTIPRPPPPSLGCYAAEGVEICGGSLSQTQRR